MIRLYDAGVYLLNGSDIIPDDNDAKAMLRQKTGSEADRDTARKGTMTYGILQSHNSGTDKELRITFDSLTSHDITYVSIIQTARASGMEKFPMPYVLTNCHNSLCAVGGTINEDDHMFALSAAKKYGGVYVPPHMAVIHSYNREMMSGVGRMILGSDSHTRYGALGTMAVGEGGGELAKQLVGRTYDLQYPGVIAVYLTGKPQNGVGPMDVALSIIGAIYENGYVKNKVMEFVGDGIDCLPAEYRNGIDVMTTETACLSSIWKTDSTIKDYYRIHGRENAYKDLEPAGLAYYDGMIYVDLSKVEPTIALPFHPSNTYTIRELKENGADILAKVEKECLNALGMPGLSMKLASKYHKGEIYVDQGIVAGCAGGTFDSIAAVADMLDGHSAGNGTFRMSVYPGSQPAYLELVKNGSVAKLMSAGVIVRSAFCGPCFGAGDTPANGELSIRHATRNFPNREGSKPGEGQISSVALMDARSIAATAINGGRLTAATDLDMVCSTPKYYFDKSIYENRVYDGTGRPNAEEPLLFGPNIKDWPEIPALPENILLKVVSYITDPVTTTDELIPSGETSSYRSNPLRLAEFTLSRKDPAYVGKAKEVQALEEGRRNGMPADLDKILESINNIEGCKGITLNNIGIGSAIYAHKPGDGSAREQAASCQRVLGASANLAREYATKRYRSNLINWGMLPFVTEDSDKFVLDDYIFIPNIKTHVIKKAEKITGYVIGGEAKPISISLGSLTDSERRILVEGCLINYYKADMA